MRVLTIRTDKPEAELGLYKDTEQVEYKTWEAHRILAETIHNEINTLLNESKLEDIEGIVIYKGPGSFTGLRIGISVANAFAESLHIPIVGATGDGWIDDGVQALMSGRNEKIVLPEYGAPVHITQQKK